LGNNANSYHPTYFTTIEEALLAGKKSISTEIKDGYDAKWHKVPSATSDHQPLGYKW
jgi:hypothetical protein